MSTSISTSTAVPSATTTTTTRYIIVGKSGNYAQWIACIVFLIFTLGLAMHSTFVHKKSKTFHVVTAILTAVSGVSYYAAAKGSGTSFIQTGVEHHSSGGEEYEVIVMRQILYGRFIDWFLSSPLILFNIALLSGLGWLDTFTMIVLDELVIFCGLMGGMSSESKTLSGWYGFGILFSCYIFYIIFIRGRRAADLQPIGITSLYDLVVLLTLVFTTPYVVVFALGDVSGHISVNTETIVLIMLDFGIRTVVPLMLIITYQKKTENGEIGPHGIPNHWFGSRAEAEEWQGAIRLPA